MRAVAVRVNSPMRSSGCAGKCALSSSAAASRRCAGRRASRRYWTNSFGKWTLMKQPTVSTDSAGLRPSVDGMPLSTTLLWE